ncbi:MAG: phospholipid-binding protein MlaC [Nitrospiraceae bacterium]
MSQHWAYTVLSGVAFGLVLFWGHPAFGAGEATEAMRSTINEVIRILTDENLKRPEMDGERRRQLEQVIGHRFSYEEMAKRTLGRDWKNLSDGERREFVELFKRLLTTTYADKVEGYSGEQVVYLAERRKDRYAEVQTKVVSGKVEIPLDYRLIYKSEDWRVYDVVVEGVSLVKNYRGQFAKVIRSSSFEDLVEKLRKKTARVEAP